MLLYTTIICFFSFPFITRNVWMGRMREKDSWAAHTHTHTHTHTRLTEWIFCKSLSSSFCFSDWNFPGSNILVVTSPSTCCLHVAYGHALFIMHMIMFLSTITNNAIYAAFLQGIPASCLLLVPGAFSVIFVHRVQFPQLHQYVKRGFQVNIRHSSTSLQLKAQCATKKKETTTLK